LLLQPSSGIPTLNVNAQSLPFKAYEPTIEIRDRNSRSVYIEVPFSVETGEAERIAVDWTARGGGGGTSCECRLFVFPTTLTPVAATVESHLQTQRAAVKMLHDRILVLVQYVKEVIAGTFINLSAVSVHDTISQVKPKRTMQHFVR
jgi:COP9 signalosome complex subunit 6